MAIAYGNTEVAPQPRPLGHQHPRHPDGRLRLAGAYADLDHHRLGLAYTLVWVFLMDVIKWATYAVADHGAGRQAKHRRLVDQPLGAYNAAAPTAGIEGTSV